MAKKSIVALIPALGIGSWIIADRILSYNIRTPFFWIWLLMFPLLLGLTTSFLVNFLIPVAENRRLALQMAMPSFFVYLLYYVVYDIQAIVADPVYRTLEAIGFTFWQYLLVAVPDGLLLIFIVALFGWLGTRTRLAYDKRNTHLK